MASLTPGMSPDLLANQNRLLDTLLAEHNLKNDRALAKALDVPPPTISKIRHGNISVTSGMILSVHETFDVPVKRIRTILSGEHA